MDAFFRLGEIIFHFIITSQHTVDTEPIICIILNFLFLDIFILQLVLFYVQLIIVDISELL